MTDQPRRPSPLGLAFVAKRLPKMSLEQVLNMLRMAESLPAYRELVLDELKRRGIALC